MLRPMRSAMSWNRSQRSETGQHARARRMKGSPRQRLQPTETDQTAARVIALRELAKVRA